MKGNTLRKIIFLDIETVPFYKEWYNVPEEEKKMWATKTRFQRKEEFTAEEYYPDKAGIFAEFGKIVCVSCVFFNGEKFQVKSFYGNNEGGILIEFSKLLSDLNDKKITLLCAHNGKEFDFPFLARRYVINDLPLPECLKISNKKPWEVPHFDTLHMWRFGDYKNYTSLALLAHVLKIPTPKADIDGSQVASIYYQEKDLERIRRYCENDATTVFKVFCKLERITEK